jgi:hypothetical protein
VSLTPTKVPLSKSNVELMEAFEAEEHNIQNLFNHLAQMLVLLGHEEDVASSAG